MVVERLSRQARGIGRLLNRRPSKAMAAEHEHRGIENAGTGRHLTILTKQDDVSNTNHREQALDRAVASSVGSRKFQRPRSGERADIVVQGRHRL
jgi:hypothetical protein